jgi:EAL domain-containing protein (putative c-di-GMP-specific phosphodiesterase class I)
VLAELRALGVRLAIDDFGTGYSSLSYLGRFAVDCLKIDRSFILGADGDRERAMITSAIVTLGHHLGLEVVAEGVETIGQLAFVTAANCDLVQGYLLGQPADAADLDHGSLATVNQNSSIARTADWNDARSPGLVT